MIRQLLLGLLCLAAYWYTVRNAIIYGSDDARPSPPVVGTAGVSRGPTFWGTGYQGGK